MSRAYLAFTAKGEALAHRLAEALPGSVSRCGGDVTLKKAILKDDKTLWDWINQVKTNLYFLILQLQGMEETQLLIL